MAQVKINPVIPECVADLKGYPLYIIVAYWGLRNNKTLTTTDVSRNFLLHSNNLMMCLPTFTKKHRSR